MSQLNVDTITNRAGTAGPTVPSLSVTGGINVAGVVTAASVNTTTVTTSSGLNVSGTVSANTLTSTVATGTSPFTVSSTTNVTNLNADLLDGQQGSFYQNAGNLNAGSIPDARLATGTANIDTFLRGDRTWASITSYSDYGSLEQVSGSTRKSIAAISTLNARYGDPNYGWTTGNPYTGYSFYTYGANYSSPANAFDAEAGAWMGLGFYPNSSYGSFLTNIRSKNIETVTGNAIGPQTWFDQFYFSTNQYSYSPVSILMMPIRNNHPSTSKSITVYGAYANYYSSGYDGSSLWYYAPGTNATYSGVTSGSWTRVQNRTSGGSFYTWNSGSISIPAQTTYVFMQMSTCLYYSAGSSSIGHTELNKFTDLATTFTDPYIQVDSRMINTMRFADWQRYGLTATNAFQFYKVYNACADMYGNR